MKFVSLASFLLILLISSSSSQGQTRDRDGTKILYTNEFVLGLSLNTNGWSIIGRKGKNITHYRKRLWEGAITSIHHPKELKHNNEFLPPITNFPNPRAFVYGKQNTFFTFQGGIGQMRKIYEKSEKNGVQVRYVAIAGASIGFIKPYYLKILRKIDNSRYYTLSDERYDPDVAVDDNDFLDWYTIWGSSGFAKGFGEMRFMPGAYGKFGLNFEWASYSDIVKSIEVGTQVDVYPKKIPIMILAKNKQIYPSLYLSVIFGWKWD